MTLTTSEVVGKRLARKGNKHFEKEVDIIIDNKKYDVPTTERARGYLQEQMVRFHLRTPSEGLLPECTRPCRKKNRVNTGATANVCAGLSNGKVVMWEYLPKTWNSGS